MVIMICRITGCHGTARDAIALRRNAKGTAGSERIGGGGRTATTGSAACDATDREPPRDTKTGIEDGDGGRWGGALGLQGGGCVAPPQTIPFSWGVVDLGAHQPKPQYLQKYRRTAAWSVAGSNALCAGSDHSDAAGTCLRGVRCGAMVRMAGTMGWNGGCCRCCCRWRARGRETVRWGRAQRDRAGE